jgi:sec-independent protein translocase protein TatC
VTSLVFWIGVSFETPLIIYIMAKVGLVTPQFLLHNWRFAVIIIAILAAMITPTVDPFNMALVMLPLIVLYGLSILLAYLA